MAWALSWQAHVVALISRTSTARFTLVVSKWYCSQTRGLTASMWMIFHATSFWTFCISASLSFCFHFEIPCDFVTCPAAKLYVSQMQKDRQRLRTANPEKKRSTLLILSHTTLCVKASFSVESGLGWNSTWSDGTVCSNFGKGVLCTRPEFQEITPTIGQSVISFLTISFVWDQQLTMTISLKHAQNMVLPRNASERTRLPKNWFRPPVLYCLKSSRSIMQYPFWIAFTQQYFILANTRLYSFYSSLCLRPETSQGSDTMSLIIRPHSYILEHKL